MFFEQANLGDSASNTSYPFLDAVYDAGKGLPLRDWGSGIEIRVATARGSKNAALTGD